MAEAPIDLAETPSISVSGAGDLPGSDADAKRSSRTVGAIRRW